METRLGRRHFLVGMAAGTAILAFDPCNHTWITAAHADHPDGISIPARDGELVVDAASLAEAADDFGHIIQRTPVAVLRTLRGRCAPGRRYRGPLAPRWLRRGPCAPAAGRHRGRAPVDLCADPPGGSLSRSPRQPWTVWADRPSARWTHPGANAGPRLAALLHGPRAVGRGPEYGGAG
jgi:hypothetical protein